MLERRRHARISFNVNAELVSADHRAPTQIFDLSLKGALVQLPDGWPQQAKSALLVIRLTGSEAVITMQVSVAHRHPTHLGLYCHHIDIDSITHLRRLIELNLGDESLLQRELAELLPPEE